MPRPARVIAWLLILTGVLGVLIPFFRAWQAHALIQGTLTVAGINFVWLITGALLLQGVAWARWLAVVWMALHVAVSALHSVQLAIVHVGLLLIIAFALFSAESTAWFASQRTSRRPG